MQIPQPTSKQSPAFVQAERSQSTLRGIAWRIDRQQWADTLFAFILVPAGILCLFEFAHLALSMTASLTILFAVFVYSFYSSLYRNRR